MDKKQKKEVSEARNILSMFGGSVKAPENAVPEKPLLRQDVGAGLAPKAPPMGVPTPMSAPRAPSEEQAADPSTQDMVRNAISKKYGFGSELDDSAIKAAQQADENEKADNLIMAGASQFGAGLARQDGTAAAKPWLDRNKEGGDAVKNLIMRRKGMVENTDFARKSAQNDPDSDQSRMVQKMVQRLYGNKIHPEDLAGLTAADADLIYKPLQLKESIDARKESAAASRQQAQENSAFRRDLQQSKFDDHQAQEARVSDKQAEAVGDFDKSVASMKDALHRFKGDFTGPIRGKIPDFAVGGEEAQFRSAVGRMADQYRKLITGAGAGMAEIARLERNIPTSSDTPENFAAKAQAFIQEVKRNKDIYLDNIAKKGKDVVAFRDNAKDEATPMSAPAQFDPNAAAAELARRRGK